MEPLTPDMLRTLAMAHVLEDLYCTKGVDGARHPVRASLVRFTRPFNVSGHPGASVPCGFTAEGLPIGLQIVGRPFAEATVLRVADAHRRATAWHTHRPPLAA